MATPIQVAIRVYGTDWGMRGHGSRQIDWLVDGTILTPENVLFVIDKPIPADYRAALEAKYHVYDASTVGDHIELLDRRRWEKFLTQWRPKHWVSYNDMNPRHKLRNAILREAGCQTWFYIHSVHDDGAYGKAVEDYCRTLDYDHIVAWGERDSQTFHGHGEQHHVLGPLFSSQVPKAVLAIFDSTFTQPGPYKDGTEQQFFADIAWLLKQLPGVVGIYKPKLAGPSRNIPTLYELPPWVSPDLIIGCADMTISLAFTSTTIEALGARRPAIFYDPCHQFYQHAYVKIPNLVAHGRDELLALTRSWMNASGSHYLNEWLDEEIAPLFGGKLDGKAADRFRELLTV